MSLVEGGGESGRWDDGGGRACARRGGVEILGRREGGNEGMREFKRVG